MKIIGQNLLVDKINKNNLDSFPHSLILLGEKGSGKHLICDYISDHLAIELVDITESISFETISDIYIDPNPKIYMIDGTSLTEKKENILLKFIEEPPINSFIIILSESFSQIIPTIVNRCQIWFLSPYTRDELREFTDDERLLDIVKTPGQALKLKNQDVDSIILLCNTIIEKISSANYANTLTIVDKFNLDNDDSKFDIDCFIQCMLYISMLRLKSCVNSEEFSKLKQTYIRTNNLHNTLHIPHINIRNALENYFTDLKFILA